jgi:glycosyltransferase involved in cell wall biosynthesis
LNAANHLPAALRSVRQQSLAISEIIIVDGGSTDATLEVARSIEPAVKTPVAEAGRGNQIAAGIEAASAEWVIILHADARLAPDSSGVLLRAVAAMPGVMGGAFGQRFEGNLPGLVPIELLNDLRALFTRTSFGDQIQFFHRRSAVALDLMPKQPLMEDLESSWRVREQGEFLFLDHPATVSNLRWIAAGWLPRFALVMRLVSTYRWARLRHRERALRLTRELYNTYYKK